MAASSNKVPVESVGEDGWPKWQIGLAIGVPVAAVLGGVWYYKRSQRKRGKASKTNRTETNTPSKESPLVSPESSPIVSSTAGKLESQNPNTELSPLEKAEAEKSKGNKCFKEGRFDQAIECYTRAINLCPKSNEAELATYYQNRAAAYDKLKNFKMVVEDTTQALEYNVKYEKALSRRAVACEQLGDLTQALEDITALCLLQSFQNPSVLQTADRVLKKLGQTKAKETFQKKKPMMPSKHFIKTYFRSFLNDPVINAAKALPDDAAVTNGNKEEEGDKDALSNMLGNPAESGPYMRALRNLKEEKYDDIIDLCTEEMTVQNDLHQFPALLLRGTFYLLKNQYDLALSDLTQVIKSETADKKLKVNAYIKRGSILIQQGNHIEGLDDFATAVRMDPENADIYHHRGHHNIQLDHIEEALRDLDNAISKAPTFPAPHVQRSFAEHKRVAVVMTTMQQPLPQTIIQSYKNNVEMFPDHGDAHALYAQALGEAGKLEEADKEFMKALEIDPENATAHVHRGLLHLQVSEEYDKALEMIRKALAIDSHCEYAYEVLGTIYMQQGKTEEAMSYFEKAIECSRSEAEMAHLFSLLDASKAQIAVAKRFKMPMPMPGMGL